MESCYDLFADMVDGSATPYLRLAGFSVYADDQATLAQRLPITVSVSLSTGASYTGVTENATSRGTYSPCGNWMNWFVRHFAPDSSESNLYIPNDGSAFTITVTLTPRYGDVMTFTESACGVRPVTVTSPQEMTTGRIHTFTLSSALPADSTHRTTGSLSWYPKLAGYVTSERIEDCFVDALTKVENATSPIGAFKFAICNYDDVPAVQAARADANISVRNYYLSADFYNGIVTTALDFSVPVMPRAHDQVDSDLLPSVNTANTVITATPPEAAVGNRYVAGYATLTLQFDIARRFQSSQNPYYRASVYITRDGRTQWYYANGNTVTVPTYPQYIHDQQTDTYEILENSVMEYPGYISDRWTSGYGQSFTLIVNTFGYLPPQITDFAVHRCVVDAQGDYTYGGTSYTKNDYGAYCLIEYGVKFTTLANSNTKNLRITYGTTNVDVTLSSYTQSGYIVVPANTERTLDVTLRLWDTFTPGGVTSTLRLSTAGVLIDFLAGGKGMAVGKVAEYQNTLDINPDWRLLFYQATVGNYTNNQAQDLVAWMHAVDAALDDLENN